MRALITGAVLLLLGTQQQMVAPKVEHKKHEQTTTYDEVIRSCPDGYEGHFVDFNSGFDYSYWMSTGNLTMSTWSFSELGPPGYTICFKKEFMDEIRKNPDLLIARPAPPKGV
jgi:hypothetical protein